MYKPVVARQFEKDVKKVKKKRKDTSKLKKVMEILLSGEKLPQPYKDHKLIGTYKGRRECHIEPNWLLIYKIEDDRIIFERTGSHSELFK